MTQHVEAEVREQKKPERPDLFIPVWFNDDEGVWDCELPQETVDDAESAGRYWSEKSFIVRIPSDADLAARAEVERERQAFLEKALEVCRRVVKQNTAVIAGPDTFGKAKAALAYFDSSVRAEGKEAGDE